MLDLIDCLSRAVAAGNTDTPAVFAAGAEAISPTYANLRTHPMAILNHIVSHMNLDTPQQRNSSASSGAGTTATVTFTDSTATGLAGAAVYTQRTAFGVAFEIKVPRDQVPALITIALSAKDKDGVDLANTFQVQFDVTGAQAGDFMVAQFLCLFGADDGSKNYRYVPAFIKAAEGSPVITATTLAIAGSNMTNNNSIDAKLLTHGHVSLDRAGQALIALWRDKSHQCGQPAQAAPDANGSKVGLWARLLGKR